jgi:uncharacterized membrane protein YraQ (UPF0718 family)
MKKLIKRYTYPVVLIAIYLILSVVYPAFARKAVSSTSSSFVEMLKVLPPIFILLGLMDVWIPREQVIKLIGANSGIKGILFSFLLGSAAAGPLYAAFPVAGIMLKKEASFVNILIFIGAWSTTKIPLLMFESSSLGLKFTVTRLIINLVGIAVIAILINRFIPEKEKQSIYQNAKDNL